jgi:ribonucleoside-diphosphate reductase alpha chain
MGEIVVNISANLESEASERRAGGLRFQRYFTSGKVSPYEEIAWERRTASIGNEKGKVIFEQTEVETPQDWSQTATNIIASKYFYGKPGTPERETSVRQLVGRVVNTIADWGYANGYFARPADAEAFRDDLAHLMLTQKASFNSPVWFNVGTPKKSYGWVYDADENRVREVGRSERRPQCSACFINSVQDSLDSILNLAKTEGMLFKFGSGTGTNLSSLREHNAPLSGGGKASGPLSFMRGYDAFAGVIKSGGTTRRAAKMVILNIDHPDIVEFIECKAKEERKAWTLVEAGYDPAIDGEAYSSIFFQNANNSVRVTDEFMHAVEADGEWYTRAVAGGAPVQKYRARDLMRKIAEAAHQCGDPGMQFDSTVNRWHTSRNTARINASNPCSEYMFLDDSACNLASLNLMKFLGPNGRFNCEAFRHAVDTVILAQEIIVDNASYPTERIARNSHDYRPLGLGYANLGALLMASGLPYDSEEGRATAGAISAVMHGQAYLTSSRIAAGIGPCAGYPANRDPFLGVIRMHREALRDIQERLADPELMREARQVWDDCLKSGERYGYRNAQVTVIAPTGTIGFMMDCDTTGIEPDLALVKYKKLVGGGVIKIVNNTVPAALLKLGYSPDQVSKIVDYIDKEGTIEGAPHLKPEHLPVFDCSFRPANGTRFIHHMGHVRMMAAVQPFVSGAISKTVNLPEDATMDDIAETYMQAWKLGLKAVAIYRDGSKKAQPLSTAKKETPKEASTPAAAPAEPRAYRRKLPDERSSLTHKFSIGGHEGYITVGMYADGAPGEVFITMAKEGSTVSGLMDSFATAISLALQYGVPLKVLVDKFSHLRFEPSGWTNSKEIPYAKSIMDYIFRWLGTKFIGPEYKVSEVTVDGGELKPTEPDPQLALPIGEQRAHLEDSPTCSDCGSIMTRNGSCYKCGNCGSTSGCS